MYMPKSAQPYMPQSATQFDPEANGATPVQTHSLIHGASDVMRSLGLGALPEAATSVNALIHGGHIQTNDPFTTPDQVQQIKQEGLLHTAKNAAGEAAYLAPVGKVAQGAGVVAKGVNAAVSGAARGAGFGFGTSQPGQEVGNTAVGGVLGALLGPLASTARSGMLTKGGVANKIEQEASRATQAGQFVHWDDLMSQARQAAIKKFGDTAATREALSNVIAPRTPAGIESIPETMQQTPEQLLQLRRSLDSSYGKTLFDSATKGGIGQLENKVASVVRQTVRDNLHRIAPETVNPDQIYKLYSKSLFSKLGIPKLGAINAPTAVAGAPAAAINALLAILGVDAGKKLFGK